MLPVKLVSNRPVFSLHKLPSMLLCCCFGPLLRLGLQGQVFEQPQVVEAAPPVPQDLAGRMSYVKVCCSDNSTQLLSECKGQWCDLAHDRCQSPRDG
jgi:hypothetical protein